MSRAPSAQPWWRRSVVIGPVLALLIAAAMLQQTTFVRAGAEISSAEGSSTKEASALAREGYETTVLPALREDPVLLSEVAAAAHDDPDTAGEAFGKREDDGKPYSYAVTATGTVGEGEFGEIALEIEGMPDGVTAGVAIAPFGASTALRDVGLDVKYGDFENQIAYQQVAIELNALAADDAYGDARPEELVGADIAVVGAITWTSTTGGDVSHVTILPVSIEVDE